MSTSKNFKTADVGPSHRRKSGAFVYPPAPLHLASWNYNRIAGSVKNACLYRAASSSLPKNSLKPSAYSAGLEQTHLRSASTA